METFSVVFMHLQDSGYWEDKQEIFYGKHKDSHKQIQEDCIRKYGKSNIVIKSIKYQ